MKERALEMHEHKRKPYAHSAELATIPGTQCHINGEQGLVVMAHVSVFRLAPVLATNPRTQNTSKLSDPYLLLPQVVHGAVAVGKAGGCWSSWW